MLFCRWLTVSFVLLVEKCESVPVHVVELEVEKCENV